MTEPDLNLLIALDVLLAEVSVAAAARRLGLSASAMSRTLSRLRSVTGDALLVRAGRQMVLTPRAEALRESSRRAVTEARAVLRPAITTLEPATLDRDFTLRANDGFVEAFGPALIAAAASEAPLVRLRFAPKPQKSAKPLREGLVDIEIGVAGEMGPEIRLQALFRDRFVGVVRRDHPLAQQAGVSVEQYTAYGHVVASRSGRRTGPVDDALAELGLQRKVQAVVPGFPAALAVARASDLVALVPASFLINQPEGWLTMFELPVKTAPITVSQMWHPRSEADPAHRWLRQLLLTVCRQQVPL
ncbi:LysR family transcriptional regulator [Erwinia persicina]|uniref:LysR family transcriptional regulator n=2 Tax=Erwinia persicina TaxID=55211 RepID=A0A3S7S361_9GAMM|nr:LysR family transcriptional regulator [Erwinia persicina]AXU95149.1 LysR family transcriptional regulator [Erwinia persicina]MBC3944036.1 LysR family transcriptional regulator [Erwinia persicina]MBD8105068.1 LysR family transcriptional regulator [Erwinia persicina]MBD8208214.1 LysR family transcriptional regulator [Erwinia persicina]MCQ4092481.1 LysR family transcriptional regulator [Erwinia persicina]